MIHTYTQKAKNVYSPPRVTSSTPIWTFSEAVKAGVIRLTNTVNYTNYTSSNWTTNAPQPHPHQPLPSPDTSPPSYQPPPSSGASDVFPAGYTFSPASSVAEHPSLRVSKERVDILSGGWRRGEGGGGIRKHEKEYIPLDNAINMWRHDSTSHSEGGHGNTRDYDKENVFKVGTNIFHGCIG